MKIIIDSLGVGHLPVYDINGYDIEKYPIFFIGEDGSTVQSIKQIVGRRYRIPQFELGGDISYVKNKVSKLISDLILAGNYIGRIVIPVKYELYVNGTYCLNIGLALDGVGIEDSKVDSDETIELILPDASSHAEFKPLDLNHIQNAIDMVSKNHR